MPKVMKTAWPGAAPVSKREDATKAEPRKEKCRKKKANAVKSVNAGKPKAGKQTAPSKRRQRFGSAATTAAFKAAGWVQSTNDPDRFDFPGTSDRNELYRYHPGDPSAHHTQLPGGSPCDNKLRAQFAAQFVHALHNILQRTCGLNNADELQALVVAVHRDGGEQGRPEYDVYLASNTDATTQRDVDAATVNWTAMKQLRVRKVTVVNGVPGRHAEQKLLEFAASGGLSPSLRRGGGGTKRHQPLPLLVGERLPCVACRVFAVPFERSVDVGPSHGHFYLSTVEATPGLDVADAAMPRTVMELLGHSTIEMSLKYCKATDDATRSAVMAI